MIAWVCMVMVMTRLLVNGVFEFDDGVVEGDIEFFELLRGRW